MEGLINYGYSHFVREIIKKVMVFVKMINRHFYKHISYEISRIQMVDRFHIVLKLSIQNVIFRLQLYSFHMFLKQLV